MVAVLFLGGLSIDMWRFLAARRHLAAIADAVALAAADGVDTAALQQGTVRLDPVTARRLAADELAVQRRGRAGLRATIAVSATQVTVQLSRRVDTTLLGILAGRSAVDVRVAASAAPRRGP